MRRRRTNVAPPSPTATDGHGKAMLVKRLWRTTGRRKSSRFRTTPRSPEDARYSASRDDPATSLPRTAGAVQVPHGVRRSSVAPNAFGAMVDESRRGDNETNTPRSRGVPLGALARDPQSNPGCGGRAGFPGPGGPGGFRFHPVFSLLRASTHPSRSMVLI